MKETSRGLQRLEYVRYSLTQSLSGRSSHIKLLLKFALDASEIMISFLYIQVGAAGAPRARSASAPANFLDFFLVLVRKTQTLSASCSPAATF